MLSMSTIRPQINNLHKWTEMLQMRRAAYISEVFFEYTEMCKLFRVGAPECPVKLSYRKEQQQHNTRIRHDSWTHLYLSSPAHFIRRFCKLLLLCFTRTMKKIDSHRNTNQALPISLPWSLKQLKKKSMDHKIFSCIKSYSLNRSVELLMNNEKLYTQPSKIRYSRMCRQYRGYLLLFVNNWLERNSLTYRINSSYNSHISVHHRLQ